MAKISNVIHFYWLCFININTTPAYQTNPPNNHVHYNFDFTIKTIESDMLPSTTYLLQQSEALGLSLASRQRIASSSCSVAEWHCDVINTQIDTSVHFLETVTLSLETD